MTTTAHYKRLVLRLCNALNQGDLRTVEEILTPDFVDGEAVNSSDRPEGADRRTPDADWLEAGTQGFIARLKTMQDLFNDLHIEILGLVAEGTTVILRLRLTGTHAGNFHNVEQVHIYEGRDGRIASRHRVGGSSFCHLMSEQAAKIGKVPTTVPDSWVPSYDAAVSL